MADRSPTSLRAQRLAWFAVALVGLALAVETLYIVCALVGHSGQPALAGDYLFYRDVGSRWLEDGSYFRPEQLAGPYPLVPDRTILYPPVALLLFVPFAVLPAILWWVIPLALTSWALWVLRPAPWAWITMLVLLAWPHAIGAYLFGNTDMWAVAFIAMGLLYGWPAVLVAFKPLYIPFAVVGARERSFWISVALFAVIGGAMLPLWFDYVTAMTNLRIDASYWLLSIPLLLIPLVAWLGRSEPVR